MGGGKGLEWLHFLGIVTNGVFRVLGMLKTAVYMRVSTACQDVDSQRQELLKFIERRDDLELRRVCRRDQRYP